MPALYDAIGRGYARHRLPDDRIGRAITDALGDASSVLNVGAGTGSYEPRDRLVVALEPSEEMIAQRPVDAAPVIKGAAEELPFDDDAFEAAMAVLTIHHWSDQERGLREMLRVASRRLVIVTWNPAHDDFWLTRDYIPEILAFDRTVFPSMVALRESLGEITIQPLLIPHDCTDGFLGAYWCRPEAYLDADVRSAISAFARLDSVESGLEQLRADLESGEWARRNEDLLEREELDIGYVLVTAALSEGTTIDLKP